ncbi:hypothetical protein L6452_20744 [Arctium lappa]|uniref:Uncharacterized protein n=1 Tax=Arctium lappa TaxID=4217 RepID=A0ACB9BBS5_ARCLA|nr:hypothetical protein L6452_20744 [Arctium lappa]
MSREHRERWVLFSVMQGCQRFGERHRSLGDVRTSLVEMNREEKMIGGVRSMANRKERVTEDESIWGRVVRAIHGIDGGLDNNEVGSGKQGPWSSVLKVMKWWRTKGIQLDNLL